MWQHKLSGNDTKGKRKVFTVISVVRIHLYANGVNRQAVKSKLYESLKTNTKNTFKMFPMF
jgi:hypothetical protein